MGKEAATSKGPRGRFRNRRPYPGVWTSGIIAVCVIAIAVVRGTDLTADHSVANVVSFVAAVIAAISALVWFVDSSSYPAWARANVLGSVIGALVVFAVLFRIDQFDSELRPTFAWRFSPEPDTLLEKLPARAASGENLAPVDLKTTTDADFPRFLGPKQDLSVSGVRLATDWEARPPELLWRQPIGAGWSAFSVVNGFAVTQEQRGPTELVTCYEARTGKFRWSHGNRVRFAGVAAGVGPRATPTIHEGRVYAMGASGLLTCLDGATGKLVWEKNLLVELGIPVEDEYDNIRYGRSGSPLIWKNLIIVPGGGPTDGERFSLIAFDKHDGRRVWTGGSRQIAYASPTVATLAGVEQVLIVNEDYAGGHDPATGRLLWEHSWPGRSATNANVSQAVPVRPDRVLLSKGYAAGGMLLQLIPRGDGTLDTKVVWQSRRVLRTKFTNVTLYDGYAYGLSDGILECTELATGRRVWKDGHYKHGQILRVGGLLLVLSEAGELLLVEATPERPNHVLGSLQAIEGMTWNNLALYGPYLLVRNAQEAACYALPLAK